MKRSYYSLLALLAVGNGFSAFAQQKDSTFIREMTIEKEYNPIVRDADKITRMPEVETPQTNKTKIEYAEPSLNARAKREVHTLEVGSVNTSYPFSNKRGYLDLAAGNYLNVKGDFGYRFIDKEKDLLGVDLHHASSNGKVKFLEESWGKTKRKINDNRANLYYRHYFESLLLKTNVAYDYSGFNYYGQGEYNQEIGLPSDQYTSVYPDQTQQRIALGLSLATYKKQDWDYQLGFGFTGFSQKMPGINENEIAISMSLGKSGNRKWNFSTGVDISMLVYGGSSDKYEWSTEGAFKNAGLLRVNPVLKYDNDSPFSAQIGIHADVAIGVPPYIGIAPDLSMNWKMAEHWELYGKLTGGLSQYSLSDLAKQNRYYYGLSQNRNSYTVADLQLGIQSNAVAGFWFDIYGKMGYTKDALFMQSNIEAIAQKEKIEWKNSIDAFTADAFNWMIGMHLKYKFSDMVGLNFRIEHNGWDVNDNEIASYKPKLEIMSGITLRPLKKLTFDLNYDIKGGREIQIIRSAILPEARIYEKTIGKLADLHQLNLKGEYRFNELFAVNMALNNLLFRKQEIYYGMPEQGFGFMAGGCIRF